MGDGIVSPESYYELSLAEAKALLKRRDLRLEEQYNLTYLACYNAFGAIKHGKKFKPSHPFDKKNKAPIRKKVPTLKERQETLAFLEDFMKSEGGEI